MLVLLDEAGCPIARTARPWDRIAVRLRGFSLDRDLAAGASPDSSVALALRAQMLVRPRYRRGLARSARRVLTAATQPPFGSRLAVPVCRDQVAGSSAEFGDLIRGLLAAGPVTARGVAQASVLVADASGPLYRRASTGDLRARVRDAADALIAA
jgi:hypothetical protein